MYLRHHTGKDAEERMHSAKRELHASKVGPLKLLKPKSTDRKCMSLLLSSNNSRSSPYKINIIFITTTLETNNKQQNQQD